MKIEYVVHVRHVVQTDTGKTRAKEWVCLRGYGELITYPHAGDAVLIPGIKYQGEDNPRGVQYLLLKDGVDERPQVVLKHEDFYHWSSFEGRQNEYKAAGFVESSRGHEE